jgi:hypothetical protein
VAPEGHGPLAPPGEAVEGAPELAPALCHAQTCNSGYDPEAHNLTSSDEWDPFVQPAAEGDPARTPLSADSKLPAEAGPGRLLSDEDLAMLAGDTPEQRTRDEAVIGRRAKARGADLRMEAKRARTKLLARRE